MKLYNTEATARGGRTGTATTPDGRLEVALSVPRALGGDDGPGTNPEQLFAAGYGACFDSALRLVARQQKIDIGADAAINAQVGLQRTPEGLFRLAVVLTGHLPSLDHDTAQALMQAAHQVCPYSNATRGNIDVEVLVSNAAAQDAVAGAA